MRRDFEHIRNILLAVAEKNITDSDALLEVLELEQAVLDYHLDLLSKDAALITERSGSVGVFGSEPKGPERTGIKLTWQGNDFLDAIGDEKAWKKVKKGLKSGAKIATIEALKQVAKGVGSAGLAIILAEDDSDLKGIAPDLPTSGHVS